MSEGEINPGIIADYIGNSMDAYCSNQILSFFLEPLIKYADESIKLR